MEIKEEQLTSDSSKQKRFLFFIIFLAFSWGAFYFLNGIISILLSTTLLLLGISLYYFILPKRCSKDGLKLNYWKRDNNLIELKHKYLYYKCPNGHVLKKPIQF